MQLDEAVQIQQYILKGLPVQEDKLREAKRVIRCYHGAQGENHSWMPEPLSTAQRDRVNAVLCYRLALACGMLNRWKAA